MALPKPDKKEISAICQARGITYPENIFEPVSEAALSALSEGFIDRSKALNLLSWLENNTDLAALFPNRQLLAALKKSTCSEEWRPEAEHDLVHFISAVYFNKSTLNENLYQLIQNPPQLFGDLYSALFDETTDFIPLTLKLAAFTGPFKFGSRKDCFEQIRRCGGAPTNILSSTDYLFVSEDHICNRVLSSSMVDAICVRLFFGKLKIYRESLFSIEGLSGD
ncbi:hypothetical protein [Pseudomonas sp. 18173]|uniref:hypothetical protein n=1 Tax=Pseudomonas sp. 18173 TaxID=3390055 RepID=UPI003D1F8C79